MYTILIFPGGRQADAVLLSVTGDCLKLAVAGRADALELRRVGDNWVNESGAPVELAALVALGPAVASRPRTLTA